MQLEEVKPSFGFPTAFEFCFFDKKKIARRSWEHDMYVIFKDNDLFMEGPSSLTNVWPVNTGDILAKDWYVVLTEEEKEAAKK